MSSTVMPVEQEAGEPQALGKRRGRPKGSKNAGSVSASKGKKGKGKGSAQVEPIEPPVLSVRLVREQREGEAQGNEIALWISARKLRNAYLVEALLYPEGDANRKQSRSQVVKTETLKHATVGAAALAVQRWTAEAETRGFIRRERGAKVELGWDALGDSIALESTQG